MAICLPARYNDRIIRYIEQLWPSIVDWTRIIGPIEERLIGFQFECDLLRGIAKYDCAMILGKYRKVVGNVLIS